MIDGDLMTIIKRKLKYNTMNKLVTKSVVRENHESRTICIPIIVAIKQFLLPNEKLRNKMLENHQQNTLLRLTK